MKLCKVFNLKDCKLSVRLEYADIINSIIEKKFVFYHKEDSASFVEITTELGKKYKIVIKEQPWSKYFTSGAKYAAETQFRFIIKAKKLGINVIEPIGYFSSSALGKSKLITLVLEDSKPLSKVPFAEMNETQRKKVSLSLAEQLALLHSNRGFIPDLHLKNFLLKDNKIYFVDFEFAGFEDRHFSEHYIKLTLAKIIEEGKFAQVRLFYPEEEVDFFLENYYKNVGTKLQKELGEYSEFRNAVSDILKTYLHHYLKRTDYTGW